jgi:hypothetical protein
MNVTDNPFVRLESSCTRRRIGALGLKRRLQVESVPPPPCSQNLLLFRWQQPDCLQIDQRRPRWLDRRHGDLLAAAEDIERAHPPGLVVRP